MRKLNCYKITKIPLKGKVLDHETEDWLKCSLMCHGAHRHLDVWSFGYYGAKLFEEVDKAVLFKKIKTNLYSTVHPPSVQFSSVAQSCPILCNPINCSTPGLPVHHQLPEFTQTHVHWVGDAIQPSHSLSSPSPPAPNPSQHQGLFQWVNSLHEVAKVLEFQLHHQSFQWTPRTDLI